MVLCLIQEGLVNRKWTNRSEIVSFVAKGKSPRGVEANVLDCDIVVSSKSS